MQFDENNAVVQLCVQGMIAEATGDIDEARKLFTQAWDTATDDFESFTAAHYMARNQTDLNVERKWNLTALKHAKKLEGDTIKGHYPTLYLNIGRSYEKLGDIPAAATQYKLAAETCADLPAGGYSDMIRNGVAAALKRAGVVLPGNEVLENLIETWCERKDLRPLSFVLPAFCGNLGTEQDVNRLISALSRLSAARCLPVDEQEKVAEIIGKLAQ